jgi:hypothetical protein
MTFLTLDIETVPQARYVTPGAFNVLDTFMSGHSPTILRELESAIELGEAPVAETGVCPALHASTCHIVQVSFGWRHEGAPVCRVIQSDDYYAEWAAIQPPDALPSPATVERALLTDALGVLAGATSKRTTVVSFNGKQFDVPMLRARAALLRLQATALPWRRLLYPYSDDQHADLRLVIGSDNRYAKGTLQWWADAFGIHAEEHGADVFGWVNAAPPEWEKLRAYGEVEARTLVELFEAVQGVL